MNIEQHENRRLNHCTFFCLWQCRFFIDSDYWCYSSNYLWRYITIWDMWGPDTPFRVTLTMSRQSRKSSRKARVTNRGAGKSPSQWVEYPVVCFGQSDGIIPFWATINFSISCSISAWTTRESSSTLDQVLASMTSKSTSENWPSYSANSCLTNSRLRDFWCQAFRKINKFQTILTSGHGSAINIISNIINPRCWKNICLSPTVLDYIFTCICSIIFLDWMAYSFSGPSWDLNMCTYTISVKTTVRNTVRSTGKIVLRHYRSQKCLSCAHDDFEDIFTT
jgi:hypothetical protein